MSRTDRFSGDAKVAGTWRSRLYGLPMRLLFLTKQKNPELLPLIAADCAWGRLKERNRGSRIEAECLTVFNQAADLSTYRRGKSVRTTRATSEYVRARFDAQDVIGDAALFAVDVGEPVGRIDHFHVLHPDPPNAAPSCRKELAPTQHHRQAEGTHVYRFSRAISSGLDFNKSSRRSRRFPRRSRLK